MSDATCDKCGAALNLRMPKLGQTWKPFYGCSRYPKCQGSSPAFKGRETGRYFHVSALTDRQLAERIERLRREGYVSPASVQFYASCSEPHGEMAMDAFDRECEYVFQADVSPLLGLLEKEQERRRQEAA